MINTEKQGLRHLFSISMPYILFSTVYSLLILFIEETHGDHIFKAPAQISSVFGLAVAFFLGFRMNSAYDRWWEARKILGELTNNTRSFVAKAVVYIGNSSNLLPEAPTNFARDMVSLIIAYIRQLRQELHHNSQTAYDTDTAVLFRRYGVIETHKISNEILFVITQSIEQHFSRNSHIEKNDLMQQLNRFHDIQGKAERIKNTPFLKIYSIFTRIIVFSYVLLLPFFIGDIDLGGEDSHFELLSIPIMVVISAAFLTINQLANLYGEPFSEHTTSVPLDEICKTIEKNCMEISLRTR